MCLWRILVPGGDIESNRGPMTKAQEEKLELVCDAIQRLKTNHTNMRESVNKILTIHINLQNELQSVAKRVEGLQLRDQTNTAFKNEIQALAKPVDELELNNLSTRTSEASMTRPHDVSSIKKTSMIWKTVPAGATFSFLAFLTLTRPKLERSPSVLLASFVLTNFGLLCLL